MLTWFGSAIPTTLFIILEVMLLVLALIIAPTRRRPSSALAWIVVIVALPLIGLLLFAVIGSPRLPKRRRDQQRTMNERIAETTVSVDHIELGPDTPPWLPAIARLDRETGAMPLVDSKIYALSRLSERIEGDTTRVKHTLVPAVNVAKCP